MVRVGLRVSEVVSLQSDDVDMNERRGQVIIRQGKGLKERTAPLSRRARLELTAYQEVRPSFAGDRLFVSKAGNPLTARDAQRLVANARRKADISGPHILRHTFATRALQQANMDLATLPRILGHDNLTTTARYLHPNMARVAEMVEEL
jgi:integrase/recombinase XerD